MLAKDGQGIHQYYSLAFMESDSSKSMQSIQGMLERYIYEKWNSSAWVICGYERPLSDDLPDAQNPLKCLIMPSFDTCTVTAGIRATQQEVLG